MPKLPNYTAKLEGAGPGAGGRRAVAADFEVGTGEIGQGLGRAGLAMLSQQEEQEARQALVASSEIRAKYAKALDEAAVSGADTAPLRQQMADELARIGENFATKQGADTATLDATKAFAMFDSEANRLNVQRAGAEAKQGAEKMIANEAKAINSNPGYLPQAVENVSRYVETFAARLSPEARREIIDAQTKRLNLEAARTTIRLNPDEGRKMLDEGKWDLSPEQLAAAQGYARSEIEYKRTAEERDRILIERERREANDKAMDGYIQRIFGGELSGKLRREILDDPTLEGRSREHLLLTMKAQIKAAQGEERKGDQALMVRTWHQINSGQLFNPDMIVQMVGDHMAGKPGLDIRQADYLLSQMRNAKDGADMPFRRQLSQAISRQERGLNQDIVLNATPQGVETKKQIIAEMIAEVESEADKMRREGKTGRDPSTLLDPGSRDYYFTPKRVEELKARVVTRMRGEAVDAAAGSEEVVFPDGVKRKWSGKGDKTDVKTWLPVKSAEPQFPITPSGEPPEAKRKREQDAISEKYRAARRGD